MPGDCINPSALGLPGSAGNGDGFIWSGTPDLTNFNGDQNKFLWKQLQSAGMLTDKIEDTTSLWYGFGPTVPGYHSPTCPTCSRGPYTYSGTTVSWGGWAILDGNGTSALQCYDYVPSGVIPVGRLYWLRSGHGPQTAYAIDAKIDDGKPLTGQIIVTGWNYSSSPGCSGNSTYIAFRLPSWQCVNATTNTYSTTYSESCFHLVMRAGF